MKRLIAKLALVLISTGLFAQNHQLLSPNRELVVNINVDNGLTYSVEKDGFEVIQPSSIAMTTNRFDKSIFNDEPTYIRAERNRVLAPLWGTSNSIEDEFTELTLTYAEKVSVQFRAYNNGAAWRIITNIDDNLTIYKEQTEFNVPEKSIIYFPEAKGYSTPFEPIYKPAKINEIEDNKLAHTPMMFKTPSNKVVVVSESNLFEYPGMFVLKTDSTLIKAVFPKYPKRESQEFLGKLRLVKWPQLSRMVVRSTEDYIAESNGKRSFPWRVIMIADSDVEILNNTLVYQLADEPQMDFSWVKPGKVVWDWYHKWNLQGVDFKPGINTQTYKYKIDFAAEHGIEYVNIDDGWSKLWSFNRINRHLDLEEIIHYANERGVGIFLWAMWNTIDKDFIANLDWFQELGIAGLKVDFFDRTDQRMVDFINELAHECAKRKLLLNLHGMYKPTGIDRTYPNVVAIEAVLGLEYNKFSDKCTPDHNLTIPFVRNVVGPMDYTPGAMRYMEPENFEKSWDNPHAMTTRAHQMAMYVVYHSGVQMLADSPTFYEKDETALSFLSDVPVSWDESVPLQGKIGEHIVVARRKGEKWYVGGMAGIDEQRISINLDFLEDKEYQMTLISDGKTPNDLNKKTETVSKNYIFTHDIKRAGGFVIIIE
ncbi:MAG: glycoside hydrolase family 97 protein [Bacteroidales bacterium]